jgi:hypothetical protein
MYVSMGLVMQELMQIPFLMIRQYYPWRSHLRWAIDRNINMASNFGKEFDAILSCNDWNDKIALIERTIDDFKKYIADNHILPEINTGCQELDKELLWAQRLNAWKNPDWKEKIAALSKEAKDHGYPDSEFWVYSLWG